MTVENPGPRPTPEQGEPGLAAPRRQALLRRLRRDPRPITAGEIAVAAGLHPNTVREQLEALVATGEVLRERSAAGGRGRPAWCYVAASEGPDAGRTAPTPRYATLATALSAHLSGTHDPRGAGRAIGEDWGRSLVADRTGFHPAEEPTRRVVALLDAEGFGAHLDEASGVVRLTRCPFLDAARAHPEVICSIHAGIARGALAALGGQPDGVRLQPFAESGACLLRLDAADEQAVGRATRGTP